MRVVTIWGLTFGGCDFTGDVTIRGGSAIAESGQHDLSGRGRAREEGCHHQGEGVRARLLRGCGGREGGHGGGRHAPQRQLRQGHLPAARPRRAHPPDPL
eukprot:1192058-Prorocentrum_minimum.AAC.2